MTVDYKFYKITNVNNEWTLKKYIECSDQKKKSKQLPIEYISKILNGIIFQFLALPQSLFWCTKLLKGKQTSINRVKERVMGIS